MNICVNCSNFGGFSHEDRPLCVADAVTLPERTSPVTGEAFWLLPGHVSWPLVHPPCDIINLDGNCLHYIESNANGETEEDDAGRGHRDAQATPAQRRDLQ